jgi:hypothetical protein
MFILDSLMISGIRWALETAITAAEAEMNDDSVLREQLLEAEMRREMGEISDDEFQEIEADLLARIREIKERREGGSGPLAFGAGEPLEAAGDERFQIEASVSGDFHEPVAQATVVDTEPIHGSLGGVVDVHGVEQIAVLDLDSKPRKTRVPRRASPKATAAVPRARTAGPARTSRTSPTSRTNRTASTKRTARTPRTRK